MFDPSKKESFLKGEVIVRSVIRLMQTLLKNDSRKSHRSHSRSLILGGLLGVATGAAAALMLTPRSGKDLRRSLIHPFKATVKPSHQPVKNKKPSKRKNSKEASLQEKKPAAKRRSKKNSVEGGS